MTGTPNWTARLAWGLLLLLSGGALSVWLLAHWDAGARFLGVAPRPPTALVAPTRPATPLSAASLSPAVESDPIRMAALEARLAAVEHVTQRVEGSAGRADALLVAFAARRAIDRGVALGYLETLLADRFGPGHERAVATIVTASRQPVRLDALVDDYEALGPVLRGGGPDEGWLAGMKRELGSLIIVRRADSPSPKPQARYDRALERLRRGEVDSALAETMRLPGVSRAQAWVSKARIYVAAHRSLDEVESAALLGGGR